MLAPLIGVDFDQGSTSPANWTLVHRFLDQLTLTNLPNEAGVATSVDLTLATDWDDDFPIQLVPSTVPSHSPSLAGLDGGLDVNQLTMTWSDLEPGKAYEVYLFGLVDVPADLLTPVELTINGVRGSSSVPLESYAARMIADADGRIALQAFQEVAGVAIAPTPAVVTNVTSTKVDDPYKAGEVIDITVTFSDQVNVLGTPQLELETGDTDQMAQYYSGSGSQNLVFRYTVQPGDRADDLDYLAADALSLNGGSITDLAGYDADPLLPAPGESGSLGANKALVIDTTPPAVITILPNTILPTNGDGLAFTVLFDESVFDVDASDFVFVSTIGTAAAAVNPVPPSADNKTFTITLSAVTGDGGGRLDLKADADVHDEAGNVAPAFISGGEANIDTTPPHLIWITPNLSGPTNATSLIFGVVFDESVVNVSRDDFHLAATDSAVGTVAPLSVDTGRIFNVSVNDVGGDGTLRLDVKGGTDLRDQAGNAALAWSGGQAVIVDHTPPRVTVEERHDVSYDQEDPTGVSPIRFTITFSEPVEGFMVGDVTVSGTARPARIALIPASANNKKYYLEASGMTAAGTVIVTVPADAAADAAGNLSLASTSADNRVNYVCGNTVGVYDPANSLFYLRYANDRGDANNVFGFGAPGWEPLAGDWNGDGRDTIGLFQRAASQFYLRNENAAGNADVSFGYGVPGSNWFLLMGDWDGNGTDTIGSYDPAASQFYLKNANAQGNADISFGYGAPGLGWTPVVGDWNGDGTDTIGFYDPATGMFYLRNTNDMGVADIAFPYGAPGSNWQPLIGDWDGNGEQTIGFFLPEASTFFLRNTNTVGNADIAFGLGYPGCQPIVGSWLGPTGQALWAENGNMPGGEGRGTRDEGLPIENAQLAPLVVEAIARWAEANTSIAPPQVVVTDLPGNMLGRAQDGVIYLDPDGAGHGWFVDPTPALDEEFARLGSEMQLTAIDARAADKIDLLTVIEHELGHLAGRADLAAALHALMSGTIAPGVRRR